MDEADNWIAERAGAGAIVITADVPLASRAVKAGAEVIAPNGRAFTADERALLSAASVITGADYERGERPEMRGQVVTDTASGTCPPSR